MRLKSVYISDYKNLKNFKLDFDGQSFIDVFVGKNGTGKSNLFEALIEIFRHLYEFDKGSDTTGFDYEISYEIDDIPHTAKWRGGALLFDDEERRSTNKSLLPDNVLVYYTGHNETVTDLVQSYQAKFSKRIKKADFDESRRFIGIGSEYKSLLLAILLLQKDDCKARQFVCATLGIKPEVESVKVLLKRPVFANKKLDIDDFDQATHFWGTAGITKNFLNKLLECIKTEFQHFDLYDRKSDSYSFVVNRKLFQKVFASSPVTEQFRLFDNLKTLEMLKSISAPVVLSNGSSADISQFSDGQFQTVYIYAIMELFKDRNCLTLLDEPDCFLHPEWQFEFLRQVFEITDTAAKNNHVLMSSHSAVTLIPHNQRHIRLFHFIDNKLCCHSVSKAYAVNQLSSNILKYSEDEQILSVINRINIDKKPVFFTEGSTDPIILTEAWHKLYKVPIPFIPLYAFNCVYLKMLLQDNRIFNELGKKPIFGLFDFDEAYNEWNHLKGQRIETDPYKGLSIDIENHNSYAFMLPVPNIAEIECLVIKDKPHKETYCHESRMTIEHLFYGDPQTHPYFEEERIPGGQILVFKEGKKTQFAKELIPKIPSEHFEVFRPMFDFIKGKC